MAACGSNNLRIIRSKKHKLLAEESPEPELKTEEKVAGRSDDLRTTRSKKRKLSADEDALNPQMEIEEVSRKRRKGIHNEKNGRAALGSVLQSGLVAAVVSAATTYSRPCQEAEYERLNTLRPRVDGRVVSVRGLKTGRGDEAAEKPRSRRPLTHSMLKVT